MSVLSLKFGTLDLSGEIETWSERMDSRTNIREVPRRHGGFIADIPTLQTRIVTITGAIVKSSVNAALDRLDTIITELNNGVQKLVFWDDRFVMAQKRSFEKEISQGGIGTHIRFRCEFECADPFLYLNALTTVTKTADVVTPPGTTTFSLTNGGDVYVFPRITFTANIAGQAITSLTLRNLTTIGDKKFTFSGTVASGNSLVVEPQDLTVKNNGVLDLTNSTGEIFIPLLSIDSGSGQGVNNWEYVGSDCTIKFEWRERFWS